ncbi:hypothetical protein [Staphylococcus edaphicus]|uniref:Uncharacterized protein n=1 Tax=Staphylococcus edaphicus TaxID=1955013 RepID=A0A2C6VGL4_9STAP|nr:hypothetical protein [Staphylococcus edaphicus]PHK49431.1 hypothetical protein BTJ66_08215 [Staphylococcus edaphicus]UQW81253.1 hypothetical protein MNY58_11820 [Staphylococcus edaphicus]
MKNANADDKDWMPIVTGVGFAMLSDFLNNQLYTQILTMLMILALIFVVIKGVRRTKYYIKTEDPDIKTTISIKADYWLLFVRNMVFYGLLAAIFFVTAYLSGQMMWLCLLVIGVIFIIWYIITNKFEKNTDIIDN